MRFRLLAVCAWTCVLPAFALFMPVDSAAIGPADWTIELPGSGEWRCPPMQDCSLAPDYRAYVVNSSVANVYLSFAGDLGWPLDEANLLRAFRYIDVYLPQDQADSWKALKVSTDFPRQGSIGFSLGKDALVLDVQAASYRLRHERKGRDVQCPGSDIRGFCITEQTVAQPLSVRIRIPLPSSETAPWARR